MLERKGTSYALWFILAFIIVLILIVMAAMILSQGEGHAFDAIDDAFKRIGDIIG